MERLLVAAVLVVVAVVVAIVVERRQRRDTPTQAQFRVPMQVDRADFERPDAPWLVAVFTSATCDSCRGTFEKATVLGCDEVLVVADAEGVVRASFVGPPTATDLWAAVAEVRFPGSSPEPHLGHEH
jgi:hypothetical protein